MGYLCYSEGTLLCFKYVTYFRELCHCAMFMQSCVVVVLVSYSEANIGSYVYITCSTILTMLGWVLKMGCYSRTRICHYLHSVNTEALQLVQLVCHGATTFLAISQLSAHIDNLP